MKKAFLKKLTLDCGKYLRACADCGKTLSEVEALFESIYDITDMRLKEAIKMAEFIGVTRTKFLAEYVY